MKFGKIPFLRSINRISPSAGKIRKLMRKQVFSVHPSVRSPFYEVTSWINFKGKNYKILCFVYKCVPENKESTWIFL